MRAASPVTWVPSLGAFLVTGRAAAVEVLRRPEQFTVDDPRFSTAQVVGQSMLSLDGAEHSRHRRPFVDPFRPRRVAARFGELIDAQLARLLDDLAARAGPDGEVDIRPALAAPLASSVVATSLGLDGGSAAVVDRLVGWYGEIVASVAGVSAGQGVTAPGDAAMAELAGELAAVLDSGDTSLLCEAATSGGLSREEVVSNAGVIMFGGIETTEGMILNTIRHVLGDPGARHEIGDDPGLIDAAVEESLRLEPAAAVVDRYSTDDIELAGIAIEAGSMVTVSLAGANRDPDEFPDPDRFDLHRSNQRRHLAFAAGPHVCIGMDLARLEAERTLATLLGRFPDVQLGAGAPAATGLVFRKPQRLPVILGELGRG